jgi:hypothetical protein
MWSGKIRFENADFYKDRKGMACRGFSTQQEIGLHCESLLTCTFVFLERGWNWNADDADDADFELTSAAYFSW